MRRKKGMTMMEVLMAMFIVIVLSSAVVVGFRTIIIRYNDHAAKIKLRLLLSAADAYRARFGVYAGSIQVLLDERYLESDPNAPTTSAERTSWDYTYTASDDQARFQADGRSGTMAAGRNYWVRETVNTDKSVVIESGGITNEDWY